MLSGGLKVIRGAEGERAWELYYGVPFVSKVNFYKQIYRTTFTKFSPHLAKSSNDLAISSAHLAKSSAYLAISLGDLAISSAHLAKMGEYVSPQMLVIHQWAGPSVVAQFAPDSTPDRAE